MYRLLPLGLDAAVAAVALTLALGLLRRRCHWSGRRTACYLTMAVYVSIIFALVGLPDIRYIRFQPNINLVPFRYFFSDRTSLPNVVLFVPLGLFLPLLWHSFGKLWRTVLFGFCVSLTIELLQIFTFRATDINDLMTNTLGTFLGWALGRLVLALFPEVQPSHSTRDVYVVLGVTFGFMVLLHPLLTDPLWALIH